MVAEQTAINYSESADVVTIDILYRVRADSPRSITTLEVVGVLPTSIVRAGFVDPAAAQGTPGVPVSSRTRVDDGQTFAVHVEVVRQCGDNTSPLPDAVRFVAKSLTDERQIERHPDYSHFEDLPGCA